MSRLPVEIQPRREYPSIRITAHWSRQSPEIVQREVTMPLEEIAAQVRDVRNVSSTTGVGYSEVTLEFPEEINLKYAFTRLQEQVAALRTALPPEVTLTVEPGAEGGEDLRQRQPFLSLELSGPYDLTTLRQFTDRTIVPAIKGLDGSGTVRVFGGSPVHLRVDLRETFMDGLELHPDDIAETIQKSVRRSGVGDIRKGNAHYRLLFSHVPQAPQDLAAIPVTGDGRWQLGDIASITLGYQDPVSISRHDYNPLVSVDVYRAPGYNALTFSQEVRQLISSLEQRLPRGSQLRITSDRADELRGELHSLYLRAGVILTVVFGILIVLFRRLTYALIVMSAIFLSLCGASILLYFTGYTINVVTLAGIALVFGLLVDNAVVVLENIQRRSLLDHSMQESCLNGTKEMAYPLIGSTVTTLFVFFALLLLQDRLGAYYKPLAFALGFALLVSFIIAMTLIPAVLMSFGFPKKKNRSGRRLPRLGKLSRYYSQFVRWNIRHRWMVYSVIILIAGGSVMLFLGNVERGGFYNWNSDKNLNVWIEAPRGTTLDMLDNIARGFENQIRDSGVPADVSTTVNSQSAYVNIQVRIPDSLHRKAEPYILKESLVTQAVNYAGVGIYVTGFGLPYYNGGYKVTPFYNTRLQVRGPQYDELWKICESILETAKESPRVSEGLIAPSTRSLYLAEQDQISMKSALQDIWKAGWTYRDLQSQLAFEVRRELAYDELPIGGDRIRLHVTSGESLPQVASVKQSVLTSPGGGEQRVQDLFAFQKEPVPLWIDKRNQQYEFTIAWEYRGPTQLNSGHTRGIVNNLSLPPGYHLMEQQWGFLTEEEESDLLLLILIVAAGTYMILASLYESFRHPLVIFFSVPFSLIGVFYSYVLFHRDFDVNGYIGLILLTGLVVNNAIILVDRIISLHKSGMPVTEAAVAGAIQRIRPIIITTVTTIGGLLPLFLIQSGSSMFSDILAELSFITIGGIVSSTLFTVTLIPLIYVSIEKFNRHQRTISFSAGEDT